MALPLLPFIYGAVVAAIPTVLRTVFAAIGLSVVTYGGITLVFDQVESIVLSRLSDVQQDVLVLVGLSGFGVFIKMQMAAYAAVIGIKIFTGGFSKLKFSGGK